MENFPNTREHDQWLRDHPLTPTDFSMLWKIIVHEVCKRCGEVLHRTDCKCEKHSKRVEYCVTLSCEYCLPIDQNSIDYVYEDHVQDTYPISDGQESDCLIEPPE